MDALAVAVTQARYGNARRRSTARRQACPTASRAWGPRRGERMTTPTTAQLDFQRIAEALVHPLKLRILARVKSREVV